MAEPLGEEEVTDMLRHAMTAATYDEHHQVGRDLRKLVYVWCTERAEIERLRAQLAEIGETRERIVLTLKCMSTKHDQDAETYADERSPLLTAQAEALWDAAQMVTNGEWMQWEPKQ